MRAMRIALVVNPGSGGGTDGDEIAAALRAHDATVDVHPFDALDALDLTGIDRLVVASGDGGVGSAAAKARDAGLALAFMPSGTANDFARALDIPQELEAAAALAADPDARIRTLDVARSGSIPFLNAAACGLSVDAAENASPLKRALGPLAYAVGAVQAGATSSALDVVVTVDGTVRFRGEAWQVIVAGTGAFGGGSELELAQPDDRALDVAVIAAGSRAKLALRAYGMKAGGLEGQDGVEHFRGRTVEITGADAFNVDGELCDAPDSGSFVLDGRVDVIVGAGT